VLELDLGLFISARRASGCWLPSSSLTSLSAFAPSGISPFDFSCSVSWLSFFSSASSYFLYSSTSTISVD